MAARIRVGLLYGGRSPEHEVSLQSARCVYDALDRTRFDVVPVSIDPRGVWRLEAAPAEGARSLPVTESAPGVTPAVHPGAGLLAGAGAPPIDVWLPIVHGPLCEDGSLQGLFELADAPYVGAGVAGSAIAMDKDIAKRLVRDAGIAIADYVALDREAYLRDRDPGRLPCPVFVKPANMGSSVGVRRVERPQDLDGALVDAFRYDTKALVEQAIDAREIEVAVLAAADGADPPEASLPGEIVPVGGFYSFNRKYVEQDGASLHVPASVDAACMDALRDTALRAFVALSCDPMARVDLFLERGTGRILFNEANTIPGFTAISMYPKLWAASGLDYRTLLTRLVDHALARHRTRSGLARNR